MPKRVQDRLAELTRLLTTSKLEHDLWFSNPLKRGGPQAHAIRTLAVKEWTKEQERLINQYA